MPERYLTFVAGSGDIIREHGEEAKSAFVGKEIDAATMSLMKDIKRVFDPGYSQSGKMF